jgi:chemotaxis protein MotB
MLLASCVSKKEYLALEAQQKETQDLLNSATVKLNSCLSDKAASMARVETMKDQLADMRKTNQDLIDTKGDLTILTKKGSENLEKSLESLKERDLKITRLQDALTKKDSVTLAIVTSLKKEVGIEVHSISPSIIVKLFAAVGLSVILIDRVVFGGLTKKELPRGNYRRLNSKEVGFLKMLP